MDSEKARIANIQRTTIECDMKIWEQFGRFCKANGLIKVRTLEKAIANFMKYYKGE